MKKLIKKCLNGTEVPDSTHVAKKIDPIIKQPKRRRNILLFDRYPNSPALDYYIDFVNRHEGQSITNTPGDKGGLTNNGITLKTWLKLGWDKNDDNKIDDKDLRLITPEDHAFFLKTNFWNRSQADKINNPKLAAYVTDYVWGSGDIAYKLMHKAFGLSPKVVMTPELLKLLNNNPNALDILHKSRTDFYRLICRRDPSQLKFLKGWLNRANNLYNANDI